MFLQYLFIAVPVSYSWYPYSNTYPYITVDPQLFIITWFYHKKFSRKKVSKKEDITLFLLYKQLDHCVTHSLQLQPLIPSPPSSQNCPLCYVTSVHFHTPPLTPPLPTPPQLALYLTKYLTVWRPRLPCTLTQLNPPSFHPHPPPPIWPILPT